MSLELRSVTEQTFSDYEREGWQRNAADYDEIDLPLTGQGFGPLLDNIGAIDGMHILELASGTGRLAAQAVSQGARLTGLDFSANMVELARQNAPEGAEFHEGSADALPFQDAQFGAVICNFGFLHFEHPGRAMGEAARALKKGGKIAFTVWRSPEQGNEFFEMVLGTVQKYANLDIGLPDAPPQFALADVSTVRKMLDEAGFALSETITLPIEMPLKAADTPFEFLAYGAVRGRMIYERQTEAVKEKIKTTLHARTSEVLDQSRNSMPCPAILIIGQKAG